MSHYKQGQKAVLGDVVRGKGYNLPYEIVGVVVGITPGAEQCNLHVVTCVAVAPVGTERAAYPSFYEEHGTCGEFTLVAPSPTRTEAVVIPA